jgi:matrix metalloproteinase-14 (membrane-inserted)
LLAVLLVSRQSTHGFTTNGSVWSFPHVQYRLNPANLDVPDLDAENAIRAGADAWGLQSTTQFRFVYAGRSAQTTTTLDSVNLVVFRDASNGSAIATTYTWQDSTGILDADIVFWDAAFRLYAGASGCSAGVYIEDIAAHEFGHALGLGHSTTAGATMFPTVSYCTTELRTLHADDIAGVTSLYPPGGPSVPTGVTIR